ncbi:MAG: hypothetical protein ACOCUU_03260 [Nanoarchaeota archaeon]
MKFIKDKKGGLFISFVIFILLILLMSFFVLDITGKVIQEQGHYISKECFDNCIEKECEDFKGERFLKCREIFKGDCIDNCTSFVNNKSNKNNLFFEEWFFISSFF